MKVLVKTNKGLKNIGEGKIYSKKQLKLNELTGFIKVAPNLNNAALQARQQLNTGKVGNVESSGADVTNGQSAGSTSVSPDPTITVDVKSPQSIKTGQSILNKMTPTEKQNTDVDFIDGSKNNTANTSSNSSGMMNSSVTPKKVMDEMRKNSVPFSKKELSNFLSTL